MSKQDERAEKLKRIVIKEELVALTGHWMSAIILNQFLYWSERTKDVDQYVQEEAARAKAEELQLTYGWIYKTAEDLNGELMVDVSVATIRKYIKLLVENNWLSERHNPIHKWDRTLQYRPNLPRIYRDLFSKGYILDGYKLGDSILQILRDAFLENKNGSLLVKNQSAKISRAIPKITIETNKQKKKTRASSAPAPISADFLPEEFFVTGKPDGNGAGNGSGGKRALTKEDGGRLAMVERLEIVFAEVRGCDPPSWDTDKEAKAAQKTWRKPLSDILVKCGEDVDKAEIVVRDVTTKMMADRLTFTKPVQILETAESYILDLRGNTGGLESMGYTYMGS